MFYRKQDHVILSEAKNPSYAGKKDDYVGKKENLALGLGHRFGHGVPRMMKVKKIIR
jgi:hypothetical protein